MGYSQEGPYIVVYITNIMKNITTAFYCVTLAVVSFVGHQMLTKETVIKEIEESTNSRTEQLCQLDKSFCK